MMAALDRRGRAIAAAARARAIARLAERAGEALPDVTVMPEPDGVALTGRGLERRMIDDAALRWIGSLLR